ncbi:hypothetical protein SLA2020_380910 [Shorea laevis]
MSETGRLWDGVSTSGYSGTAGVRIPKERYYGGPSSTFGKNQGGSRCCIAQVGATRHRTFNRQSHDRA